MDVGALTIFRVMIVLAVLLYLAAYATYQILASRRLDSVPLEAGVASSDPQPPSAPPRESATPAATRAEVKRAALRILGAGGAGLAVALLFLTMLFPSSEGGTSGPRPGRAQSQTEVASQPGVDPSSVKFATVPSGLSLEERNALRLADLPKIQAALEAYAASKGSYPANGGLQSVCRFIALDVGCLLAPFLNPFPIEPAGGDTSYAYQSDGKKYLLTTIWEGSTSPPEEFACPSDFRRSKPMICLFKQ